MKPSHLLFPSVLVAMLSFSSCGDIVLDEIDPNPSEWDWNYGLPSPKIQIDPGRPVVFVDSFISRGDSASVRMRIQGDTTIVIHQIILYYNDEEYNTVKPLVATEVINDTLELSPTQPYRHWMLIRNLNSDATYIFCNQTSFLVSADTVTLNGGCQSFRTNR